MVVSHLKWATTAHHSNRETKKKKLLNVKIEKREKKSLKKPCESDTPQF